MKTLYRFRFLIFAVAAVALVVATVFTLRSGKTTAAKGSLGPTNRNVQAYVAQKRAYLSGVAAKDPQKPGGGLVSLSRFLTSSQASALVSSGKVVAVFVKFPASDPQALRVETTISDTMSAAAPEVQQAVRAEITGLEKEAASTTGEAKKTANNLLAQRRGALSQVQAGCACIYALVVESSSLSSLAELAKVPDVRVVDVPEPPVATLRGWNLRPLLPATRAA